MRYKFNMNHHSTLSSNSKPTPYWPKKNYNKQQILHPKMIVDSLNGNVNDRVKTTTKKRLVDFYRYEYEFNEKQ